MKIVLAYLTAKPGKADEFQEKMLAQAKRCLTREPGCLQFDVARDTTNPDRFVMVEAYVDGAAFEAHKTSEHFIAFRPVGAELLADRRVEEFDVLSDGATKRGG